MSVLAAVAAALLGGLVAFCSNGKVFSVSNAVFSGPQILKPEARPLLAFEGVFVVDPPHNEQLTSVVGEGCLSDVPNKCAEVDRVIKCLSRTDVESSHRLLVRTIEVVSGPVFKADEVSGAYCDLVSWASSGISDCDHNKWGVGIGFLYLDIDRANVSTQLAPRTFAHYADGSPSGNRGSGAKTQGQEQQQKTVFSRICHAVLSANIGVVVLVVGILFLIGWWLILWRGAPFLGTIVLLLGFLTFAINKREARRTLCEQPAKHQAASDYSQNNYSNRNV